MKSEWHRYNLKRRVAQLPPIDELTFNSKISANSTQADESADLPKKQITKKELRRKQREAIQQQRNELLEARKAIQSKMSALTVTDGEQDIIRKTETQDTKSENDLEIIEPIDSQQFEEKLIEEKLLNRVEFGVTTCLFCPDTRKATFESIEENIEHMFKKHGLYIPEINYLVDKEGLIRYLGEKIGLGNICLVCNYQGRDVPAVREHMEAKRHMRIPYESEDEKLEISDFYDFSSTYDSVSADNANQVADGADEDWEDVSDDNEDIDDFEDVFDGQIVNTGTELVLPSGAVVGHRSLARFYRQNLPPERVLSEGQGTVIAAESRHFLTSRSKFEVAAQKRAWGREKKREDINDRRAAKFINNQPHFRDPLLQ